MSKNTTDLRTQVIDAVCFKPDITGHLEQFERIEQLISNREKLAYKDGYIKGGIDEILRHEEARKLVGEDMKTALDKLKEGEK